MQERAWLCAVADREQPADQGPSDRDPSKRAGRVARGRQQKRAAPDPAAEESSTCETYATFTSMLLACHSLAALLPCASAGTDAAPTGPAIGATGKGVRKRKGKAKRRAQAELEVGDFVDGAADIDDVLPDGSLTALLDKAPSVKVCVLYAQSRAC
jgi:hypothetical protein